MPVESRMNVLSERSSAFFVFHTFMTWGRKAIVVRNAAIKPIIVTFIFALFKTGSIYKVGELIGTYDNS